MIFFKLQHYLLVERSSHLKAFLQKYRENVSKDTRNLFFLLIWCNPHCDDPQQGWLHSIAWELQRASIPLCKRLSFIMSCDFYSIIQMPGILLTASSPVLLIKPNAQLHSFASNINLTGLLLSIFTVVTIFNKTFQCLGNCEHPISWNVRLRRICLFVTNEKCIQ